MIVSLSVGATTGTAVAGNVGAASGALRTFNHAQSYSLPGEGLAVRVVPLRLDPARAPTTAAGGTAPTS
eukprot:gene46589-44012_t